MADQLSLPLPPVLPSHLQAAVEATLLGEGWGYSAHPITWGWTTIAHLASPTLEFTLEYGTHEALGRVLLQLVPEFRVSDATRAETALLLSWINSCLHCNTFHLIPGRDEVRLRICLAEDLHQTIDTAGVTAMTYLACTAAEKYCPVIREVAEGRKTAQQALPALPIPAT